MFKPGSTSTYDITHSMGISKDYRWKSALFLVRRIRIMLWFYHDPFTVSIGPILDRWHKNGLNLLEWLKANKIRTHSKRWYVWYIWKYVQLYTFIFSCLYDFEWISKQTKCIGIKCFFYQKGKNVAQMTSKICVVYG